MNIMEQNQAKGRILQIYKYLQALDQLRNPVTRDIQLQPWSLWFKDLPTYPTIEQGKFENIFSDSDTDPSSSLNTSILKVKRPVLTDAPTPPSEYLSVLKDAWKKPELSVRFNLEKIPKEEDGEELTEAQILKKYIQDQDFAHWYEKRNRWAEKEIPARQAMSIYNQFYELYARLERESEQYELILGDGLLYWGHTTGLIHHPILLLRLKLEFDPSIPEFSLIETDQPVELYTALFRTVSEVTGTVMSRLQEELEQKQFHPLGGQETEEYYKRIVTQLSPFGQLLKPGKMATDSKAPRIVRDPLIFLRKRSLGFSKAIEEILKDIPERTTLPGFLENVVGIDNEITPRGTEETVKPIDPNGEDEEILLSKPANSEQLQIADRLNYYNAVLVQGPPGTGKTHTIANLIGHLLAQGKSVLVTSHTSKALSVLHEKIVEPLQPLCLSVLTDDSRKQLERSVDAITERLANSNPDQLEREALSLQTERLELLKNLRETRQKLLEARADEYRPIVLAGEEYAPAQAARRIRENREKCSWLPGPVRLDVPLPLSEGELIELYRTNLSLTPEDEKELGYSLPNPEQLVVPHEFEQWVQTFQMLAQKELTLGKEYWQPQSEVSPETLEAHLRELQTTVNLLQKASKWQLEMIEVGTYGEDHIKSWQNLLTQIESACTKATQAKETLLEFNPQVSEECLPNEIEVVLEEIIHHLKSGGSLNFIKLLTKGDWKTLINQSQVNGKTPQRVEHFEALQVFVDLRKTRKKLLERWERQVTVLEGPTPLDLGSEPEYACRQFSVFIKDSLNWYNKEWLPLLEKLQNTGFLWKEFYEKTPVQLGEYGELLRLKNAVIKELSQIVDIQVNRLKLKQMEAQIGSLKTRIEQSGSTSAQATLLLLAAIQQMNPVNYREAYQRLVELINRSRDLYLRKERLARLEIDAPAWAAAIAQREGIHGEGQLSGKAQEAWIWRQFVDELDDRAKKSMEELLSRIALLAGQLREKTALLVERKAWAAQVRRTTVPQRQALNGWKQFMHRAGKGKGKRAPALLAEARKLMPMCQSAVPVWIMPLSRVVENFNPRFNRFDVVIIDEASQADVLALTALYMGKQVVVVGDNEQVSPSAVGQKIEETDKLIEEHLLGVPNAKLYDGLFSIYDLAGTAFQPICLREHFRCVTPIIQFSNYLSYDGKIKPLRDESTVKVRPHTVAYRVEGGTSHKKTNEKEAQVVASLVVACTEQPEYKEASIGVISLVGEEQAVAVDRLLQQYLPAEEYKMRRIQCGNPAQFQGDERDIIFLSMVDGAADEGPLRRKSEGANEMYKKRYNVAASRARDQMWVVYSLDPENDLKSGDLRGELIKHAKDPQAILKMLDTAEKETESEFEKQVLFRFRQAGYTVHPQWKVGGYRIDMVVECKGKRVALECDGDKWHTLDNLAEDMSRQAILERLGWRFIRIRGSEFFRDPESVMTKVFARLTQYEIFPEEKGGEETSLEPQSEGIKDLVIRRAEALRKSWNGEEEEFTEAEAKNIANEEIKGVKQTVEPVKFEKTVLHQAEDQRPKENVPTNKSKTSKQWNRFVGQFTRPALAKAEISTEGAIPEETRKPSPVQTLEVKEDPFDLIGFLNDQSFEWLDNRKIGGTVWVIGREDLSPMMEKLRAQGFRFRYKPQGGRMTNNRPAWYLSE